MTAGLAQLSEIACRHEASRPHLSISGRVLEVSPSLLHLAGLSPFAQVGDLVAVDPGTASEIAEIVQIGTDATLAVPYRRPDHIRLGARATLIGRPCLRPDMSWLGRVIDPLGTPLDGDGPLISGNVALALDRDPPAALDRNRVQAPLKTGIRAIDVFTPLCLGQRIGIFAGSGVGKSTLLAMLSDVPDVTAVVLALVGERGREVREFLEDVLGSRRHRLVAIVSTGDDNPAMRRIAPKAALTVAEFLRDRGERVLLLVDSLTRFAHAQRETALAAGEPPVARGYPPSVFSELARLVERAGPGPVGSGDITMVATVLVDGDDHNDPVADAARGLLDGHIVLDRKIAAGGRWPAIDFLASLSRLSDKSWNARERSIAEAAKALVARFEDTRDLRLIGGYQPGTDAELDKAVALVPRIYALIGQRLGERLETDVFAELAGLIKI
ncbi:MAG: FliI/YscN family ATPase [Hyphomicrobium sp.]|nr:FliI/YscN family ATPase [Hyphomicrobium sp.]